MVAKEESLYSNPQASTNMTMVAVVKDLKDLRDLSVYVAGELAGIAQPQIVDGDTLYFVTVQSDGTGMLRFELNGETLTPEAGAVRYVADDHLGSVSEPVVLTPTDDRPYKVLEDNHVVIIRNDERYDVTGKKL